MNDTEQTCHTLLAHIQRYPKLEIADVCKFLYQSAFGCEHLVTSLDKAEERIRCEASTLPPDADTAIDPLDGAYSRVPLGYLRGRLQTHTLATLFCLSAKSEPDATVKLERKLSVAAHLAGQGLLNCTQTEFTRACERWKAQGYPALHHSDTFRAQYHPAYRVIANRYLAFLPLLEQLDSIPQGARVLLAIEGGSASGKTTLAKLLERLYGCTVFHTDDYFLRPEQRTAARLAEPGGNMDRERFFKEILQPLSTGLPICYRRFDCSTQSLLPPISCAPQGLIVIEGAYSMHPELADLYQLSVFLEIPPDLQKKRIQKRNTPQLAVRFFEEWIPMERAYFNAWDIPDKCTLRIPVTED